MANAKEWEDKLNGLVKPTYESKYQSTIDDLLGKITNREQFSYDFNADPIYQQYKDSYTKMGKDASINAAANASALTGGYGNSYAATAATQANQQYLTQLNNVIPELYNAAMNKYQMESDDLYRQYSAYGDAEDRNYGRYRDAVSDYYSDRDYYTNGYNNERSFEYQQNRDKIADAQWEKQFAYNQQKDAIANSQWQQSFDKSNEQWDKSFSYQQDRDKVSDAQWNKNYALQQAAQALSASNAQKNYDKWLEEFKYQKEQDTLAQQNWEKEFNAKNQPDESDKYAASDSDFKRYESFAERFMTEQSPEYSRQYLESLYYDGKLSENQVIRIANRIGL